MHKHACICRLSLQALDQIKVDLHNVDDLQGVVPTSHGNIFIICMVQTLGRLQQVAMAGKDARRAK